MPVNRESNSYIIMFTVIMVVVVAVLLSFVSNGLKPIKDLNVKIDEQSKILKSAIEVTEEEEKTLFTKEFVEAKFSSKIKQYTIDHEGNIEENATAFEIKLKAQEKLPVEERTYPLFIFEDASEKYYIIPLVGLGLWDEVSGYMAIKGDFRTVQGAAFDHKGETPGLGAEIAKYWFREQFANKSLINTEGEYSFDILKGRDKARAENEFQVDGLSGATITADGVEAMIEKCYGYYKPYFNKLESTAS